MGYCDVEGCRLLTAAPQAYPNGIIKGSDGLIYVAHSSTGDVQVNELQPESSTLKLLDTIKIPHPIDNLSEDSNGDIFVASFPQLHKFLKSTASPFDILPPTTAWRIRKAKSSIHQVDKVLEDDGSVLPSATVVVHDPQTGRMFLGGEFIADFYCLKMLTQHFRCVRSIHQYMRASIIWIPQCESSFFACSWGSNFSNVVSEII